MYRNIDTGNGKKEVTEASGSHVTDRIEILKLARTSNDDTWGRAVEERVEAARNFAHGRIVERARRGRGGRSATAYSSISKKYKPADMQMPGGSARCFACMDVRSCRVATPPRFPGREWLVTLVRERTSEILSPQIARHFVSPVSRVTVISMHKSIRLSGYSSLLSFGIIKINWN